MPVLVLGPRGEGAVLKLLQESTQGGKNILPGDQSCCLVCPLLDKMINHVPTEGVVGIFF